MKRCLNCNKEIPNAVSFKKFCSIKCRNEYRTVQDRGKYKYFCDFCGEYFEVSYKKKGEHVFCSKECNFAFVSREGRKVTICESCGEEFVQPRHENHRFCSTACVGIGKKNLVGEKSPSYMKNYSEDDRTFLCKVCGEKIKRPFRRNRIPKHCSKKCAMAAMINSLTKPHVAVCNMLDELGFEYLIEEKINGFFADVLIGSLVIEVMGTYWHCDVRKYNQTINDKQQRNVERDCRKKHSLNDSGYKILYLWEDDIIKNSEMCSKLLEFFVLNNGDIDNHHSMNYHFEGGILFYNDVVWVPYFEYDTCALRD